MTPRTPNKNTNNIVPQTSENSPTSDTASIDPCPVLACLASGCYITGKIERYLITAMVDSGASGSILSAQTYYSMHAGLDSGTIPPLRKTNAMLQGATGSALEIHGEH